MRSARTLVASLLLGVLILGQVTALRCPMLSTRAKDAPAHLHHHGSAVPADEGPAATVEPGKQSNPGELPAHCLMVVNCGTPGIPHTRAALQLLPGSDHERNLSRSLDHVDPIVLITTPPPRA